MTPCEINAIPGNTHVYKCRGCNSAENLSWFMGTSCPVCNNPECHKQLSAEYNSSYDEDDVHPSWY